MPAESLTPVAEPSGPDAVVGQAAVELPPAVPPGRARVLRWLVRLRTALLVASVVAIAVYFVGGLRPGVRLAVFACYGLVAAAYVGVYLYALATRRPER